MLPVLLTCIVALQPGIMLDRTLAIVSGRAITLSDARTALALGLVEGDAVNRELVQRLADRELMLRETDRYDPPEPADDRIEAGVAAARQRAGGEDALARILDDGGFTMDRLRAWVRNDLRVEAYLRQRFVADARRDDLIADWISDLRRRGAVVMLVDDF
ncbi:MAG: hypothetical protein R2712_15910 [Vicinamibacterales bacterium]